MNCCLIKNLKQDILAFFDGNFIQGSVSRVRVFEKLKSNKFNEYPNNKLRGTFKI